MNEKIDDSLFNECKFFSCNDDPYELIHETPEGAINDYYDENGYFPPEGEIYGFSRIKAPDNSWFVNLANECIEIIIERWYDEFEVDTSDFVKFDNEDKLKKDIATVIRKNVEGQKINTFIVTSTKKFTKEEMTNMLK